MTPVMELARKKLLVRGLWSMPFIQPRTAKHLIMMRSIINEERM